MTTIARTVLAIACFVLAPAVYALDRGGVLPATHAWHVSETGVLAIQGIMLFVIAGAVRHASKSSLARH